MCLSGGDLIAADTGNHRLLIWHDAAAAQDHREADIVIGKDDMASEGPGMLNLPTGLLVAPDGRLLVADAWHHRILIWDSVPARSGIAPDAVLGQPGIDAVDEGCGPDRFYWPFGIALVDGAFWVADTGNRRVLGWLDGIPEQGRHADVVLGQPDMGSRGENRDGPVRGDSLRWPHSVAGVDGMLFVADAGNHRVLGWEQPAREPLPARAVLGQPDFETAYEHPYGAQGPSALRFPYGVASENSTLYVADTSNNRVLALAGACAAVTGEPAGCPFDAVIGQADFDGNGENRWEEVRRDTLCWPYGLAVSEGLLAVADSGNNRVMLWRTAC